MMNNYFNGMGQNIWIDWFLFVVFWIGIGLLIYLGISKIKDQKTKIFLTIAAALVTGSIFLGSLLGSSMFVGMGGCNQNMMKSHMKEMSNNMMEENNVTNEEHESHH